MCRLAAMPCSDKRSASFRAESPPTPLRSKSPQMATCWVPVGGSNLFQQGATQRRPDRHAGGLTDSQGRFDALGNAKHRFGLT